MDWIDEGIVIGARQHGEANAVLEVLTREHGRHLGLVRGGRSRRQRPVLQSGNVVKVEWKARLSEHLGNYTVELLDARAARSLDDAMALAGLSTLCALARLLPERDPHAALCEAALIVLEHLEDAELWPSLLVRWEMALLDDLGFGLDLAACAATGRGEELIYVSPKSGRAVSREAGEPYREKLLALPGFLRNGGGEGFESEGVLEGFALTGHFLRLYVFEPRGLAMPESRERLVHSLRSRHVSRP